MAKVRQAIANLPFEDRLERTRRAASRIAERDLRRNAPEAQRHQLLDAFFGGAYLNLPALFARRPVLSSLSPLGVAGLAGGLAGLPGLGIGTLAGNPLRGASVSAGIGAGGVLGGAGGALLAELAARRGWLNPHYANALGTAVGGGLGALGGAWTGGRFFQDEEKKSAVKSAGLGDWLTGDAPPVNPYFPPEMVENIRRGQTVLDHLSSNRGAYGLAAGIPVAAGLGLGALGGNLRGGAAASIAGGLGGMAGLEATPAIARFLGLRGWLPTGLNLRPWTAGLGALLGGGTAYLGERLMREKNKEAACKSANWSVIGKMLASQLVEAAKQAPKAGLGAASQLMEAARSAKGEAAGRLAGLALPHQLRPLAHEGLEALPAVAQRLKEQAALLPDKQANAVINALTGPTAKELAHTAVSGLAAGTPQAGLQALPGMLDWIKEQFRSRRPPTEAPRDESAMAVPMPPAPPGGF